MKVTGNIVRVKAPSPDTAWQRVLNEADRRSARGDLSLSFYNMRIVEVAPANAAGNLTYECRLLLGKN
jgi:hypothetical protein